jgi:hypothetical protein
MKRGNAVSEAQTSSSCRARARLRGLYHSSTKVSPGLTWRTPDETAQGCTSVLSREVSRGYRRLCSCARDPRLGQRSGMHQKTHLGQLRRWADVGSRLVEVKPALLAESLLEPRVVA